MTKKTKKQQPLTIKLYEAIFFGVIVLLLIFMVLSKLIIPIVMK